MNSLEVDPRLAVGGEAHDLPLVGVGLEAEMLRHLGVEEPQRVGPGNRRQVLDPPAAAGPEGGRLPGAAAVQHQDGGVVEPRVGVRADGVRQVVGDELELGLGRRESAA